MQLKNILEDLDFIKRKDLIDGRKDILWEKFIKRRKWLYGEEKNVCPVSNIQSNQFFSSIHCFMWKIVFNILMIQRKEDFRRKIGLNFLSLT
jgi:hypothetical protein